MAKPVFLIGYMGCGKSTVGKKLASKLKYNFIDVDSTIEDLTNKPVSQIFEDEGEHAFRQLEHSIIVSLCSRTNTVIATGGGAPCFHNNMELMNAHGITVYLKMHPKSLAERIISSKTERPLIKYVSNDELPAFITQHLNDREAFYKRARLTIQGESLKIDELVQRIKDINS